MNKFLLIFLIYYDHFQNNNEVNTNINNKTQDKQNQQQKFMRKRSRSISLIQKNKLGSNIFKEELKLKVTINAKKEDEDE